MIGFRRAIYKLGSSGGTIEECVSGVLYFREAGDIPGIFTSDINAGVEEGYVFLNFTANIMPTRFRIFGTSTVADSKYVGLQVIGDPPDYTAGSGNFVGTTFSDLTEYTWGNNNYNSTGTQNLYISQGDVRENGYAYRTGNLRYFHSTPATAKSVQVSAPLENDYWDFNTTCPGKLPAYSILELSKDDGAAESCGSCVSLQINKYSSVNFEYGVSTINLSTQELTIANHNLGEIGEEYFYQFEGIVAGLSNYHVYRVEILDANTIKILSGVITEQPTQDFVISQIVVEKSIVVTMTGDIVPYKTDLSLCNPQTGGGTTTEVTSDISVTLVGGINKPEFIFGIDAHKSLGANNYTTHVKLQVIDVESGKVDAEYTLSRTHDGTTCI